MTAPLYRDPEPTELAVLRELSKTRALTPEQIDTLLQESIDKPISQVVREKGWMSEERLNAIQPPGENRVGKYALVEKIGQGGMGQVWKARD